MGIEPAGLSEDEGSVAGGFASKQGPRRRLPSSQQIIMKFENQIHRFPGCVSCRLVRLEQEYQQNNPTANRKHIILTGCKPELPILGFSRVKFSGEIHDLGRLDRLKALHPQGTHYAVTPVHYTEIGFCEDYAEQKLKEAVTTFLHVFRRS